MEIVITFDTTTAAIGAEKALEDAGISVKIMNLPSSIRAGCGICLRVAPEDIAKALAVFANQHLNPGEIYCRTTQGGKSTYTPYTGE